MRFTYSPNAGEEFLKIEGSLYNHIYQSRRTKIEKKLFFRNLMDGNLYTYEQIKISRNHSELKLCESFFEPVIPKKEIHLIWAIIENKIIEKTLPYLNQMGVAKITFFYANRSQKNEKILLERLKKILICSCEQCGRSSLMCIEMIPNTQEALKCYPKSCVFDFGGKNIYQNFPSLKEGIFIGPEGGFDPQEKEMFKNSDIYSINENFTLKSECAALILAGAAS